MQKVWGGIWKLTQKKTKALQYHTINYLWPWTDLNLFLLLHLFFKRSDYSGFQSHLLEHTGHMSDFQFNCLYVLRMTMMMIVITMTIPISSQFQNLYHIDELISPSYHRLDSQPCGFRPSYHFKRVYVQMRHHPFSRFYGKSYILIITLFSPHSLIITRD